MEPEQTKEQESAPQQQAKAEILLAETGALIPKSVDEGIKMCAYYLKSKLLPARFNSVEMVFAAWQFALELGLRPLIGMRQIAVVQGTACTFGDLPLAIVRRDGHMKSHDEYWIDANGERISAKNKNLSAEAVAAVCIVERKGDPEPCERHFSLADAKRAGLGSSPTWKAYPSTMMKYRARSQALKDKFPDSLNGIAIAEYDFHVIPTEESPALGDAASSLNAEFVNVD